MDIGLLGRIQLIIISQALYYRLCLDASETA